MTLRAAKKWLKGGRDVNKKQEVLAMFVVARRSMLLQLDTGV